MVQKLKAEGYQEFQTVLKDIENKSKEIFILFSGSKDTTGHFQLQKLLNIGKYFRNVLPN